MKLTFQPTRIADLDGIITLEQDPDNKSYICPYSLSRHQQVIQREDEHHIKVTDQENKLVGFMILANTEKETSTIELRRIVIQDKGKGYGRQCMEWVKTFAFNELGAHRLWLDVFTDNRRACHLYESVGFQYEGTKRETVFENGNWKDQHIYSIINNST